MDALPWIDTQHNLLGKVVLLRAGLNTPLKDGVVRNDFRIRKALPTLRFLHEQGAKTIVIAHIGREENETLAPVAAALNEYIPTSFTTRDRLAVEDMKEGEIVLLENLRQDPCEAMNDDTLAQELATLADIFVQDAFSVCHREHASIVGIPKYIESYGGLLLKAEVSVLEHALTPEHPALFVLGGAKFATKEPLIQKFLDIYDDVLIVGALQNEVLAARGHTIGLSRIEDGAISTDILNNKKIFSISDVIVERADGTSATVSVKDVSDTDTIVDIGEASVSRVTKQLGNYSMVLWNGPFGWYEKGYDAATKNFAYALADSGVHTVIGGGDTVAVIQKEGLENKFEFISTGGGAMLQFLLNKTLPGLEALR